MRAPGSPAGTHKHTQTLPDEVAPVPLSPCFLVFRFAKKAFVWHAAASAG